MARCRYPTDLVDAQWPVLEPVVPAPKPGGRPPKYRRRGLVKAMLYFLHSGEAWRLLLHNLPPWQPVYHYFRLWRDDGTRERIHTVLRERVRVRAGQEPTPSAGIIDSQSVKTADKGSRVAATVARR